MEAGFGCQKWSVYKNLEEARLKFYSESLLRIYPKSEEVELPRKGCCINEVVLLKKKKN